MAYYSLEPWGAPREDFRASVIAATVLNAAGAKPPVQPQDIIKPLEIDTTTQDDKPFTKEQRGLLAQFQLLAGDT